MYISYFCSQINPNCIFFKIDKQVLLMYYHIIANATRVIKCDNTLLIIISPFLNVLFFKCFTMNIYNVGNFVLIMNDYSSPSSLLNVEGLGTV